MLDANSGWRYLAGTPGPRARAPMSSMNALPAAATSTAAVPGGSRREVVDGGGHEDADFEQHELDEDRQPV